MEDIDGGVGFWGVSRGGRRECAAGAAGFHAERKSSRAGISIGY